MGRVVDRGGGISLFGMAGVSPAQGKTSSSPWTTMAKGGFPNKETHPIAARLPNPSKIP